MLAGLLSQSYDTRKPSVFVYFPLLNLISFNGKPQPSVTRLVCDSGLLLNQVLSGLVERRAAGGGEFGHRRLRLAVKRSHQNPACDLRSRQMLSAFRRSVDEFQNENSIRQHGYLDCL